MCASVAGHMGLELRGDGQARAELDSHGENWDLRVMEPSHREEKQWEH